MVAKMLADI